MKPALLLVFIICGLFFCACKKSPAGINYTAKMGGVRNWHVTEHYNLHHEITIDSFEYFDTTYYSNQSFALVIVNENSVEMNGNKFTYAQTDSNKGIFLFTNPDPYVYISYYYTSDSIVYIYGDGGLSVSDDWTYCTYR